METQMPMFVSPTVGPKLVQIADMLPVLLAKMEQTEAEIFALKMGIQHYTRQQTAELLGFSLKQLDEWTEKKRINPVIFNAEESKRARVRFTYAEIKRFSDAHLINTPDHHYTAVKGRRKTTI